MSMASRVVSVDDLKPAGFRWLTLKRIHVSLGASISGSLSMRHALPDTRHPVGRRRRPCAAAAAAQLTALCHLTLQWEDPHGRRRIWESAERTTRRGDVDGVAIVAKVSMRRSGGGWWAVGRRPCRLHPPFTLSLTPTTPIAPDSAPWAAPSDPCAEAVPPTHQRILPGATGGAGGC